MLTTIKLNNLKDTRNNLRVSTFKCRISGKIETIATVCKTYHDLDYVQEFQMFHDFCKVVLTSEGRATKKRIAEQHRKALFELENIKKSAIDHYKQKGETLVINDLLWIEAFNDKNFRGV